MKLKLLMVLFILCFGACGTSEVRQDIKPENNNISVSVTPVPPPTSPLQPPQDNSQGFFHVLHFVDEPIALLDAKLSDPKVPSKSNLTLEIQNVSGKPVKFVRFGLGRSDLCSDLTHSSLATPRIGYGDWSVRYDGSAPTPPPDPVINPNDRVTIKVLNSKDPFLKYALDPGSYRKCPETERKPELLLMRVYFVDGTVWDNLEQKIKQ